jgi:PAS domain S-box-containing protein
MESSLPIVPLPVLLPYLVMGICLYSGLNHLLIFYRNRAEKIHGIFWTMCFLIALLAFSSSQLYQATTVPEAAFYLKSLVGFGQIFFLFFLWFVGLYTNYTPKKVLLGISALHGLVAGLNLIAPGSILFSEIHRVGEIALPGGSRIWMVVDYDISPAITLFFASYLTNFSFDAYACYRYYRKGGGVSAHLLALSLFLFIGSVTHDILMSYSLPITPVTWSEYGFLAVIVLMSLKISTDYYRRSTLESEKKHRRLVEGLDRDYFIYSKTPDGQFDYLSPSAEGIFGRSVLEIIGKNWRQFIDSAESLRKGNEAERACGEGSRPEPFEIQLAGGGEHPRTIEILECPILDANGKVIQIEGIGKDVTAAKSTERELMSARDSLRQMNLRLEEKIQERTKELRDANDRLLEEKLFSDSLLESLPGVFYLIRGDGTLVRWNKLLEEVSGYTSKEIGEMQNSRFFKEEDFERLRIAMSEIFRGGSNTFEAPVVFKNGSERPYFFTGAHVLLKGEDLLIGMGIDVTEKREAEERFRRAHHLLQLHIENSPLAVIGWDREFQVQQWSPRATEVFGWNANEVMGKHWREFSLIHPEDLETVEPIAEVLINGTIHSKTSLNRNLRKDGSTVYCEWHNSVVHDGDGRVVSLLSFVQDVTEKKQIEQEILRYREQLEKLVVERTQALEKAQEDLVRQEKLATLGQVMATISHELRNPLGTIRGSFYTLQERIDKDPGLARVFDRIHRNLVRCDRIIDELLVFVRDTGLDLSLVCLDTFLTEAIQDYLPPKGVELELRLGIEDCWVRIDEERFRRCLVNLLNNACDAILNVSETDPARGGRLIITASESNPRWVDLRIKDSGTGISPDLRQKIFEPLFSTKSFGIGLGLHIVKNIMEQHGGGIEVEESSEEGTTMRVWLPVAENH